MKSFKDKKDFKKYLDDHHQGEKIRIWVESPRLKDGTELHRRGDNFIYARVYDNNDKCNFTPQFSLGYNYHDRKDAEMIAGIFEKHIGEYALKPSDIKF